MGAKIMKLLTKTSEIKTEFERLMRQYKQYYWITAWASAGFSLFKDLLEKSDRIIKIIVGIHFYQTHPDFIREFISNKNVRFIKQPAGTFHPKLYLFVDSPDKWEAIVGSTNFTAYAFTKNVETDILISNKDPNSASIFKKTMKLIDKTWKEATSFTLVEFENYETACKNTRSKIKSLSGDYGAKKRKAKPLHQVKIINRNWKEFFDDVCKETSYGLDRRLRVIEIANQLFKKTIHFNELQEDERKFIAGLPNKLKMDGAEYWGFFGSMKGAGIFSRKINENDSNISLALDQIPLSSQITRNHYDNFVEHFIRSFSGNYIATATRLLSMKRPDIFICFDSKNKSKLCKDFEIRQSMMDYNRYWDDILEKIFNSDWWLNPVPRNEREKKVSEARAAFLDSLYYEE